MRSPLVGRLGIRPPREAVALLAIDLTLALVAWWMAFWLRFNLDIPDEFERLALVAAPWCAGAYGVGLWVARVSRPVWAPAWWATG